VERIVYDGFKVLPLISWGNSEIFVVIHVVDVGPLHIKWQIVIHVSLNVVLKVLGTCVTPLALLPSEGPHWSEHWLSNEVVISLGNVVWIGSEEQGDISDTARGDGCKVDLSVNIVVVDDPVLGMSQVGINTKP